MSLLINSISGKNLNTNSLQNQIRHIETLINSLNIKVSHLPKEEKDLSTAINAILDFYQLSISSAKKYLRDFHSEDLVDSISYFSTGYYALGRIRNTIIYKAAK